MPVAPPHRSAPARPPRSLARTLASASTFDALVARTMRRLRRAGPSIPAATLETLARAIVRDAMSVALRWAEH